MNAIVLSVALLALAPGADPSVSARVKTQAPASELPGYRIGPEDVLQISVWNNEPISRTTPVRPDGNISLPLLNDVPAAGLTPMELREQLVRRLADYMPNAEVSVIVGCVPAADQSARTSSTSRRVAGRIVGVSTMAQG